MKMSDYMIEYNETMDEIYKEYLDEHDYEIEEDENSDEPKEPIVTDMYRYDLSWSDFL